MLRPCMLPSSSHAAAPRQLQGYGLPGREVDSKCCTTAARRDRTSSNSDPSDHVDALDAALEALQLTSRQHRSRSKTSNSHSSSSNSSSRNSSSSSPATVLVQQQHSKDVLDRGVDAVAEQVIPAAAAIDAAVELQQQVRDALAATPAPLPQQQQQQQQPPRRPQGKGVPRQPQQQQQQQRRQQQRQREEPLLLFQGGQAGAAAVVPAAAAAAPGPAELAAMLTAQLSKAKDMAALVAVSLRTITALTPIQIAAAVTRAAHLINSSSSSSNSESQQQQQQYSQQQLKPWVEQLLGRFAVQMRQAGPTEISCVVGGLARMGLSGTKSNVIHDVTLACLESSLAVMSDVQQMDNKLLMQLAWGTARLSIMPPVEWLQAFEAVSIHRMSTFNNIETANLIWVFAKWGVTPSPPWMAAYSNQLQAQLLALAPPELCSVLWAAAMMPLALPNPVMDALLLEAQVKFVSFNGQALGTLAWSLARMDVKPKAMWLHDFVRYSQLQLPALATAKRDQPFTNIIWALACWEHVPPKPWLQEFCRCVIPQLASMPTHSLAILAVSLAELHHSPPQEFSSYMLELFHKRAMAATAGAAGAAAGGGGAGGARSTTSSSSSSTRTGKAVSLTSHAASFMWALPRLLVGRTKTQHAASRQQQQQQHRQQGKQGQQQQQQVAGVSNSWMKQYCWLLQDLCDLILPGLEKLSPTELVDVAAGLADMGYFPGVPWMDAHEAALNRQLDALTDAQISIIKAAYGTLGQLQQQQASVLLPEQYNVLLRQQAAAGTLMRYSSSMGMAVGTAGSGSLDAAAAAAFAAAAAEGGSSSGGSSGGSDASKGNNRRLQHWQPLQPQQGLAQSPRWIAEVEGSDGNHHGSNGGSSNSSSGGSSSSRREDKRSKTGRLKGRPNKGFKAAQYREAEAAAVEQAIAELSGSSGSSSSGGGGGSILGGYAAAQGSGFAEAFEDAGWDLEQGLEAVIGPKGRDPTKPRIKPPKSRAAKIRLQKIREAEQQERQQRWEEQQQLEGRLEQQRLRQQWQQERERAPFEGDGSEPQWSWVRDSDF